MEPRDKWRRHVRRWNESGLTRAEYAARARVNAHTLSYWKWRLAKEGEQAAPGFVEVSITPWPAERERIEVVVDGGIVVRVPEQFDDDNLRRVLRAVRGAEVDES